MSNLSPKITIDEMWKKYTALLFQRADLARDAIVEEHRIKFILEEVEKKRKNAEKQYGKALDRVNINNRDSLVDVYSAGNEFESLLFEENKLLLELEMVKAQKLRSLGGTEILENL